TDLRVFHLGAGGDVTGVRVDHATGLYDPAEYFARLQRGAAGANLPRPDESGPTGAVGANSVARLYLVLEKVTAAFEQLPAAWPIAGTTGYDFANLVNGLFVDGSAEAKMTRGYYAFIGER